MKRICIVGVGLIGGSLGMALRRVKRSGRRQYQVMGLGRNLHTLRKAKAKHAIDTYAINPKLAVQRADIVFICVPVQSILLTAKKLLPYLKKGAILSDVGSIKGKVVEQMSSLLRARPDVHFVGGHPVAGSEKTGVENAHPRLFKKATCVLTKDNTKRNALNALASLWKSVGAKCRFLNAKRHDEILALTSHLPHMVAFSLFSQTLQASKRQPVVHDLIGGSFRDMTRVAAADPEMWAGVLDLNRSQINKVKRTFTASLDVMMRQSTSAFKRTAQKLVREKRKWR